MCDAQDPFAGEPATLNPGALRQEQMQEQGRNRIDPPRSVADIPDADLLRRFGLDPDIGAELKAPNVADEAG